MCPEEPHVIGERAIGEFDSLCGESKVAGMIELGEGKGKCQSAHDKYVFKL